MIRFDDIAFASLSDVGVRRSHNQDSLATLAANDVEQWEGRGHIFVVADGMGAHAVGELASKLAADSIPHIYSKHAHEGPVQALRKAFTETNLGIHTRGQQNREFAGMGTTGTALLLRPEGAWVGHVGDSRCYRIRDGKIQQLSFDHSLVWELARRQNKAPEELVGVPTNVIVRSLGPEPLVQVDVEGPYPIHQGDFFLLCSDGLSGQVNDREIGAVVSNLPPEEACRFLINLANLQGGPDNITAIIIHVATQSAAATQEMPAVKLKPPSAEEIMARWSNLAKHLNWSFLWLGLGIILAVVAIYLTAYQRRGDLVTFLAAAVALVSGLVGLMRQNAQEQIEPLEPVDKPTAPHIYHETTCAIEIPVIQRLLQAVESLEERVKEKNWEIDWDACRQYRESGQLMQSQGDLPGAFREDCRAMLMLMESISNQRNKEESFKPLWDKEPPRNGRGKT